MSPTPWEIQYAAQLEEQRQAAEAQQLLAQQQAAYNAAQVAGAAVPRNAEGFASPLVMRSTTCGTQVRFAGPLAFHGVIGTSVDKLAGHVRVRPFYRVARLRRPWLPIVLDSQNVAAQPPSER